MSELVFAHWYMTTATYRDGELAHADDSSPNAPLLQALGFTTRRLEDLPTALPPEFDRGVIGHWRPPTLLADLERQYEAWRARVKAEQIERLRRELARLEAS